MEVTGTVKNRKTNETIVGAAVFKSDLNGKPVGNGVLSDIAGKFTIPRINNGDFITASIIGMKPLTQRATTSSLDFLMQESAGSTLGTVEIVADRPAASNPAQLQKDNKKSWIIAGMGIAVFTALMILIIRKS